MKNLFYLLFMLSTCTAKAQTMQKYLSDTKEMVKQGNYKEALERYIWFQDHSLENDKAMSGVRLSFALADWKALGDVYPPALAALNDMRDKKVKQLIDNNGDANLFGDVAALNRTLHESKKTIDLFEVITSKRPDIAKQCWIYAQNDLFTAKRYDIIGQFIGNPLREFAVVTDRYYHDTTMYPKLKMGSAHFKAFNENNFVEKSVQLIDFSLAVNDTNSAKEIQQKALNVLTDYRLKNALSSDRK